MPIYALPFEEYQCGWYEIETDSIEEARQIAIQGEFTEDHEPYYKKGYTTWDENEIEEITHNGR
jgi:hypothetical protein